MVKFDIEVFFHTQFFLVRFLKWDVQTKTHCLLKMECQKKQKNYVSTKMFEVILLLRLNIVIFTACILCPRQHANEILCRVQCIVVKISLKSFIKTEDLM